ncbi:Fatty acid desaturase [Moraxella catarrhalis]|uniref:Fatty acid desaturase n=1 Tax=Moraxella catarrhalis TaxID=480 RepID=A0A198XEQ6_MORCA|nr:fatty acid desaturase [Moraxella catarrhalis]MPX28651.1 fatty acid desaturase [Moraxella catarrhalis]OAV03210.1 Fatty acid desaturase [Moraxella catarrhalis]OAV07948.1 Fatty acid desaturase [Moraxella catarrhalis]OAV20374.1 Fatty acid desaturase [Moraxella catarrhalis]OAV24708.1 Fatty acid desaturase [Moraxella catarrhalis]
MSIERNSEAFEQAPINWVPAIVLLSTLFLAIAIVPWYLWTHGVGMGVWVAFAILMAWTGLSITAGYHRLWSHKSYEAHPVVKYILLLGATLAVESSVFDWCSGHRSHHRHVDDEYDDPYSSRRGFWFSHMGWMLRKYPSGQYDYKNIPDLKKDKLLALQHKYYGFWVIATNVVVLAMIGWITGDMLGTFLIAGLLRLVLTHHFTFFINSLCHMFGTRPYTDENTARDNGLLAIVTWGEGYHNYHHYFQYDYRNGVKWWQYDPTKWIIGLLAKVGLASNLKRVDDLTIKHAELTMQFKRAQERIATGGEPSLDERLAAFKERISAEYDEFTKTVEEWHALKAKAIELKRAELADRLNEADEKLKAQLAQIETKILEQSKRVEQAYLQLKGKAI